MRKLNLLFAGALAICGLNVQAQERMWYEDFETGLGFFTDSAKIDSITGLDYYIGRTAGNGTWDVNSHKDGFLHLDLSKTPIYLYHAIAPVQDEFRWDEVSIEQDQSGVHAKTLTDLGGLGGKYYLQYIAGPSDHNYASYGGSNDGIVNDYQANVFVRGLNITPNSPYRVTYFMNMYSPVDSAQMEVRVMRGYYDSEKAFTTNGDAGAPEFIQTVTNSTENKNTWKRYSYVTYYTNDSIANKALHQNGYWWTTEWADTLWHHKADFDIETVKQFANNEDLDSATTATWGWIKQPNTFYLRFAFRGPHSTYQVDDIALYNSWIGGAEFCGDMLRVNFGYQTNLEEIANSDGVGQVEVPTDAYVLTATMDGDPVVFSADPSIATDPEYNTILAAEFHKDGYLYLWITDDFEFYDDIRFSLLNSKLPEDMKLKYTDSKFYPKANDAEWVAAGKIVPDIENEIVLQGNFSAVSRALLPPAVATTTPEINSFNLVPADFAKLTVKFNKPVYVGKDKAVQAIISDGSKEYPFTNPRYVDGTYCTEVEFDVPAKATLAGTINVFITNAMAADSLGNLAEGATAHEVQSFEYYFTDPAAALADTASVAYKNYALLEEALGNLADKIDVCDEDLTMYGGAAYDAANADLETYEIDAFYAEHKAPSQYTAASDALKKTADALQARIDNINKYVALKDKYDTFLAENAAYSDKPAYQTLAGAADQMAITDVTTLSNDDVTAMVPALQKIFDESTAPINTIKYTTQQIKSLAALNEKLGVKYADGVQEAILATENDNQELAKILKLYATKAIYSEIAANGKIDTLDATGFLTNAKLYATGQLGKEINEEYYQYSSYNRYPIVRDQELTTVLPGWTISSNAGSVMCGANPDHAYEGGYYVQPGFAIDGAVWCDWTSQFTLTQTATDLPNGLYTLAANFGGGEDNIEKQYVTANGDTVAAGTGQDPNPVYLAGIKVSENTMDIKANHEGCNAWARLNEFSMTFDGALEGFDYAAEAANMDEKINEALTIVETAEFDEADAKFFNLNGIEAKEGLLIKVQNGKASKIFR